MLNRVVLEHSAAMTFDAYQCHCSSCSSRLHRACPCFFPLILNKEGGKSEMNICVYHLFSRRRESPRSDQRYTCLRVVLFNSNGLVHALSHNTQTVLSCLAVCVRYFSDERSSSSNSNNNGRSNNEDDDDDDDDQCRVSCHILKKAKSTSDLYQLKMPFVYVSIRVQLMLTRCHLISAYPEIVCHLLKKNGMSMYD